ncbi:MAG TPA: pitrilysin family protein, partial [Gemmatimonadales bacterium]|nr:pitrilysin family protein [Gemmatimonadales bacterium]
ETVAALGVPELRALHARAYRASNVIVAASGNVRHDQLLAGLRDAGWDGLAGGATERPRVPPARPARPSDQAVERDTQQMHLVLGNIIVPHGDPRRHALMLVNSLFGGGMSSRLFQRVREELGLAYSVSSFHSFHADSGTFGVYLASSPETAAEATEAVRLELRSATERGFTRGEVEAGRGQLKGQITLSLESPSSRMYRAAGTELYGEPFRPIDEVLAEIDAIREEDVAAVAARFFAPDRQTVLSLGPRPVAP